ncbi:MAG: hypothetical protein ABFC94_18935 [Syntrophomonas sp.]
MDESGIGISPGARGAVRRELARCEKVVEPLTFHRGAFLPEGAIKVERKERSE